MTSDTLRRLAVLGEIRKRVVTMRPQLQEAGVTDLWHLEEAERLLDEMFAAPAAIDFRDKSLSFQWHVSFLMAEFEVFKAKKREEQL
jgi:hypothetical protein